jgi:putative sterol carrier protein
MVVYGSEEWVKELVKKINESEAYEKAAKKWEGDFIFTTIPDGTGTLTEETSVYCDLWHGKCRDAYLITPDRPAPEKVEYVYAGKYGNWLKLFDGKIGPLKGIMQRKFDVKCSARSMAKLMRALKAAQELVKCTTMIEDVEYP